MRISPEQIFPKNRLLAVYTGTLLSAAGSRKPLWSGKIRAHGGWCGELPAFLPYFLAERGYPAPQGFVENRGRNHDDRLAPRVTSPPILNFPGPPRQIRCRSRGYSWQRRSRPFIEESCNPNRRAWMCKQGNPLNQVPVFQVSIRSCLFLVFFYSLNLIVNTVPPDVFTSTVALSWCLERK